MDSSYLYVSSLLMFLGQWDSAGGVPFPCMGGGGGVHVELPSTRRNEYKDASDCVRGWEDLLMWGGANSEDQ